MALKRWQDWINVILGAWMVISPWVLGFVTTEQPAARSAWFLGAAIIVFAGSAVYLHKAWEEALNIILGICLIASPWALGFADKTTPAANAVVVGVLVTGLGLWAMLREDAVQKWWHEHGLHRAR
ncbi:MAG TPA: SPW repeat protein [Steroidobacteraceae bacterium]|jgi:hypothetical protein|nr:SPW repeat protein [Steroidobacteraceae bacterium]